MNFIELFCGAGGLSVGLEMAGLKCLLGVDKIKPAVETFKMNHPDAEAICDDIQNISSEKISELLKGKELDLIAGGPPCQGFSTIGANKSDDKRNFLFFEFVRIVKDLKPKFIIMENVTGLLARKNEKTLETIISSFTSLGYVVDIRVLSSHHYGVPEKRRRTILLGNRMNNTNQYPEIKFDCKDKDGKLTPPRTVGWAFENLTNADGKTYNNEIALAEIKNELELERIKHIPEGKNVRYEIDEKKFLPEKLWFGVNWKELSENRFREAKLSRLDSNKPAGTINTNKTAYYHPKENRYLTPREAAAIQSFPADYVFSGTLTQIWTQIGNAVPPLMAKAIGESVMNLNKNRNLKESLENYSTDIKFIRSKAFLYTDKKAKKDKNEVNQLELFPLAT